eukprot:snap_masked-scaffold_1-processed-gene-13.29-mRNA-1 protein AED:1.00 eAED:1.00 QI:0/0/0/0/1/1/2/0/173
MTVIENYCIGNRAEILLLLEDKLNRLDGRYFLERLTDSNKSYRNFKMFNGELDEQKVIHKMFRFAPKTMDILLLIKELGLSAKFEPNKKPSYNKVFGKVHQLAMKAQDEYKRRINANGSVINLDIVKPIVRMSGIAPFAKPREIIHILVNDRIRRKIRNIRNIKKIKTLQMHL